MKILITGGSGFIGTHLIRLLSKDVHELKIFDKHMSNTYPEFTTIGDVRNKEHLNEALKHMDLVIHLAAEHKDNVVPKSLYYDVNVGGTKNLVEACESNGVHRIIFTSTVAVYGLHLDESLESSPLKPFNDYGKSKRQAESILSAWSEQSENRALTIIRPTVVFGEENRGNVYTLMKQVVENRFMMIGNGQNKKSIAYVGNLVRFVASTLENSGSSIVNYADKPDLTTTDLVTAINQTLGRKYRGLSIPYWMGVSAGYLFDLAAKLMQREFPISSIRIKKFCSNSTINADRLNNLYNDKLTPLPEAIERTIRHEFLI